MKEEMNGWVLVSTRRPDTHGQLNTFSGLSYKVVPLRGDVTQRTVNTCRCTGGPACLHKGAAIPRGRTALHCSGV